MTNAREGWLTREQVLELMSLYDPAAGFEDADVHALGRMALAALEQEWRPIETAPKQGRLMLWYPNQDEAYKGYWMPSVSGNGRFWSTDGPSPMGQPTHWLPLPTPPKEA